MKKLLLTAALLALLPGATFAAETQPNNGVCIWTNRIDHTTIEGGGKAIIFYMRDGKAWKNTLLSRCPELKFNGFAYETHDGQICSNMQSIRVIHSGAVCMLGNFEPYTPPPKGAPEQQ
jgi:hypothetical protein